MLKQIHIVGGCMVLWLFMIGRALAQPSISTKAVGEAAFVADSTDFVKASLLLVEPDCSSPVTCFGHVALRMQCPSENLDFCFTFEMSENISFINVLRGEKCIGLLALRSQRLIDEYNNEGRSVTEYPLNLTLEEKKELWRLLDSYIAKGLFLPGDYPRNGCSEETATMVEGVIKGKVMYGEYTNSIGHHHLAIANRLLDRDSWLSFFLHVFCSTDVLRPLYGSQRLLMPTDLAKAWAEAYVVDEYGSKRRLSVSVPTVYKPTAQRIRNEKKPWSSPCVVFGILLAFVAVVSAFELKNGKMPLLTPLTDALTLSVQSLFALALLVVYAHSALHDFCGWNWHFVPFNLVPLAVYACMCMTKRNSPREWIVIYAAYAWVLTVYAGAMLLYPEPFDTAEYLLVAILYIRCVAKLVQRFRNNTGASRLHGCQTVPKKQERR